MLNYREFMGGLHRLGRAGGRQQQRPRLPQSGQRRGVGVDVAKSVLRGNYKAAYCLAVCPAGEDVIGPFLTDRKAHLKEIVRPLQEKEETVYVTRNSDAEDHVAKRFPHKKVKHVGTSLRPNSIEVSLKGMPNLFRPGKSAGLNVTFHFTHEQRQATVVIQDRIRVKEGYIGQLDLHVTADSQTWIGFLRKEKNVVWALLRRKIRLEGPSSCWLHSESAFPSN